MWVQFRKYVKHYTRRESASCDSVSLSLQILLYVFLNLMNITTGLSLEKPESSTPGLNAEIHSDLK